MWLTLLLACTGTPSDPPSDDLTDDDPTDDDSGDDPTDDDSPDPPSGEFNAVFGASCPAATRLGRVELAANSFDGTFYVNAFVWNRTHPQYGDYTLSDGACSLHMHDVVDCGGCDAEEVCGLTGSCEPIPRNVTDLTIDVNTSGGVEQFTANEYGYAQGQLTGSPAEASVDVRFGDALIRSPTMPMPTGTLDLTMEIPGGPEAPEGVELSWAAPPQGGLLTTEVPINHHAAGPIWTDCSVDASVGSLSIAGPLVEPLAISTGLEFQSADHVFVSAAEIPGGCVEIKHMVRQYVSY